ncbi:MAG TPA: 2-dehydropantoate 2-reductase [Actinomycetes bacterium]|nr:2-dehydropantoate 2-reductase [Actinomycetes bacterium]
MARGPLAPWRVAVLGPGAVGGLIGALLARRGDEVICLAPPATAAHIARQGVELRSPMLGDARVAVRAASRLEDPVDACFVTVKATQLERAVEAVPAEALGRGLVVPFLNGVDHVGWLRERYPADQVVAATVAVESTRVAPGVIQHDSPFVIVQVAHGPADPARVEELAARLSEVGLDVTVRDSEAFALWTKLAMLAPIALLTTWAGAPIGEARSRHHDELVALVREAAEAARAEGVELDPEATIRRLEGLPPGMRSSMLKDAEAGQPIELDAIGGAVLRAAARGGVDVPVTAKLVADLQARTG